MNNTAPIWMGIAAIAGLVGIIATGVGYVLYELPMIAALFVGAVVASVAGLALALGWREPRSTMPVRTATATAAVTPVVAPVPVTAAPEPVTVAPVTEAPVIEAPVADAPVMPAAAASKPVFLSAARDGGADDLKLIKGVGPKLEQTLHGMGIFHFDQIAVWGAGELAWMDDNLEGFKGRASRDNWVPQAKVLATDHA